MKNNRQFKKGQIPWNKGIPCSKGTKEKISDKLKRKFIGSKNPFYGKKHSLKTRRKLSLSHFGKSSPRKGIPCSPTSIRKMIISKLLSNKNKGKNHYNWKGGITPENERIRKSVEYKLWRKAVFERDNFTCQKTGIMGGLLHPHHINNFADFPELRFAIDNGITLSADTHMKFHQKYGMKNNTKEQLEEFLSNE